MNSSGTSARRPVDDRLSSDQGTPILISDSSDDEVICAASSRNSTHETHGQVVKNVALFESHSPRGTSSVVNTYGEKDTEYEAKTQHVICAQCDHVSTRLSRLKSHGTAKHNVHEGSQAINEYVARSKELSCAGWRVTHCARIASVLGRTAVSDAHLDLIVRVLVAHMVRVLDAPQGAPKAPSTGAATTFAPSRTPRKDVVTGLERAGFITAFSEESLCGLARLAQNLHSARKDITPAQVYANARFVHRFVKWGLKQPETQGDERRVLTRPELATRFIKHLENVMSPYSVRNHVLAIRCFIDLILTSPESETRFNAQTKPLLREAASIWSALKNETSRKARRIQNAKIRSGTLKSFPLYEICLFLRELRLGGALTDLLARLSNAPRNKGVPADLIGAYTTVMCALACSMLLQGVRLSAAQGMTFNELQVERKEVHGRYIVRIGSHKTARYSGPQPIAVHFIHYDLFEQFYSCKKRLGLDITKVFTTHRNAEPNAEYLSGPLNRYLALRLGTPIKVTFNALRKKVESSVFLLGGGVVLQRAAEQGVTEYLAHSRDVNELHYKFLTNDCVLEQSNRLNEVLVQLIVMDMAMDAGVQLLPQNALDSFPSKDAVNDALTVLWDFLDVPLLPISCVTYQKLRAQWRSSFIDEAAQFVAENSPVSTPASMRAFIAKLPDIWREDSEMLLGKTAVLNGCQRAESVI